MLIIPKKGYRVCLHCGKILLSRQVIKLACDNKMVNSCPYCKIPEDVQISTDILDDVKGRDLFNIALLKTKEFYMTPQLEEKYNKMYDNCLIPKGVRV